MTEDTKIKPIPMSVDGKFVATLIDEDTKIHKQLVDNILRSLNIGIAINVKHPGKDELMSLDAFITACRDYLSQGYTYDAADQALRAYGVVKQEMNNVIIPRVKEVLRQNVTIAIRRKHVIENLYSEVEKLREENKHLKASKDTVNEELVKLKVYTDNINKFVTEMESSELVKNWEHILKTGYDSAFQHAMTIMKRDIQSIATFHQLPLSLNKLRTAVDNLTGDDIVTEVEVKPEEQASEDTVKEPAKMEQKETESEQQEEGEQEDQEAESGGSQYSE